MDDRGVRSSHIPLHYTATLHLTSFSLCCMTSLSIVVRLLLNATLKQGCLTSSDGLKGYIMIVRGRLYNSCVQSSMLHRSETWPVRKENKVALQQAEMRMVRWMCGVNLQDRVPSKQFRERLGLDDIISVQLHSRL